MKILHLSIWIDFEGQYSRSGTYHLFQLLDQYFSVFHVLYTYNNILKQSECVDEKTLIVKLKRKKYLKLWNILRIYYINLLQIRKSNCDLIWIGVTPNYSSWLLFLYRIFFFNKLFFIQLYTPSVSTNYLKNKVLNTILGWNLKFFNHIGSGTDDNIRAFKIRKNKVINTEPGYKDYGFSFRSFSDRIHLIYIGTITSRSVHETVIGLKHFMDKHLEIIKSGAFTMRYDIIGSGSVRDVDLLAKTIVQTNLSEFVTYHGPLDDKTVSVIIKDANIGVAYLPLTDYYMNLPSSKIIEYFLSGLAVVSVDTNFARTVVVKNTGILCKDNPESFSDALFKIVNSFDSYNSETIRSMYIHESMIDRISKHYVPALQDLILSKDVS